jgi:hypothetical protein
LNAVTSSENISGQFNKRRQDETRNTTLLAYPQKITLSWKSINVQVEKKSLRETFLRTFTKTRSNSPNETILTHVQGVVEPGEILALMGAR